MQRCTQYFSSLSIQAICVRSYNFLLSGLKSNNIDQIMVRSDKQGAILSHDPGNFSKDGKYK